MENAAQTRLTGRRPLTVASSAVIGCRESGRRVYMRRKSLLVSDTRFMLQFEPGLRGEDAHALFLETVFFGSILVGRSASKMFFHIYLDRNMQLHPRHFGPHLRDKLIAKLIQDVEGTCSGRHGFVVAVTAVETIGSGLIRDGTGFVTFPVKYQCVVFRPFKGEILESVVTMVNKMGFFAEAGPVQIFVSNHLIPDDMVFQSGDVPSYETSDGSVRIQKDSEVRLKIVGTRVDATEIFCIGTIKDDFLGLIGDPGGAT